MGFGIGLCCLGSYSAPNGFAHILKEVLCTARELSQPQSYSIWGGTLKDTRCMKSNCMSLWSKMKSDATDPKALMWGINRRRYLWCGCGTLFMNFTGLTRAYINTVSFPSGAVRVIHFLDEKIEFLFPRTCCDGAECDGGKVTLW